MSEVIQEPPSGPLLWVNNRGPQDRVPRPSARSRRRRGGHTALAAGLHPYRRAGTVPEAPPGSLQPTTAPEDASGACGRLARAPGRQAACTPRSVVAPDLDQGGRGIPHDLVLDHHRRDRPLRPGASCGVVEPPAFRTPRFVRVSSLRLSHCRTTFFNSTSAPSTLSFTCLTSFCIRPPWLLISTP